MITLTGYVELFPVNSVLVNKREKKAGLHDRILPIRANRRDLSTETSTLLLMVVVARLVLGWLVLGWIERFVYFMFLLFS